MRSIDQYIYKYRYDIYTRNPLYNGENTYTFNTSNTKFTRTRLKYGNTAVNLQETMQLFLGILELNSIPGICIRVCIIWAVVSVWAGGSENKNSTTLWVAEVEQNKASLHRLIYMMGPSLEPSFRSGLC